MHASWGQRGALRTLASRGDQQHLSFLRPWQPPNRKTEKKVPPSRSQRKKPLGTARRRSSLENVIARTAGGKEVKQAWTLAPLQKT